MKRIPVLDTAIVVITSLLLIGVLSIIEKPHSDLKTENIALKSVNAQILADGQISSQNEAKLQFQTGGRLTYLPVKEGSHVNAGQTIASLDTYALQRNLTTALNNYRSNRDTFDQTQENANTGARQGSSNVPLNPFNPLGVSGVSVSLGGDTETNVMNDIAKRVLDQNQANLDNTVIQVELANYALQLATLTSPIDGIVTHEDVTLPNVNVTPATTFIVDDPNTIIMRAQVREDDIDFISNGARAIIYLNGNSRQFIGNVVSIHPQKTTLTSGENVYFVDIASDLLKDYAQFGQSGSVQIQSNTNASTKLIPTWTILNHQYVWVDEDGKKILRQIQIGKTHGLYTEVLSGLSNQDSIVISPQAIINSSYSIL